GLVEPEESLEEGGNRELKEEVGYGARHWKYLSAFTQSPNYMKSRIHSMVAWDLYEERLKGDEPEPLEVVEWSFDRLLELNDRPDFSEARALATLFLVKEKIQAGWLETPNV
ncbi:NUDIX domain-containing protein, partial [Endozoicomonas sp. SESOKO2]|uniref:NUDIX domain-containing protein n=1 Tax=Endozoicomonas sp. SESOKO2 TaxID=2828743 RepID=UPI002147B973